MKYHLIYIPGLGDQKVTLQQKAVNTWKIWGVEAELLQMNWSNQEPWQSKFDRILSRIDALAPTKKVVLVGASAGASAVINAYAARKQAVIGSILIAGKVNHPELIGQRYHQESPAFIASASLCQESLAGLTNLERARIFSKYALIDEVVNKSDSIIPGAKNRMVLTTGHAITIGTQLLFGVPSFLRFIKQIDTK